MNKLIAFALILCMSASISVNAFATTFDQGTSSNTGDTEVKFTVNPTYTVTVPAKVELAFDGTSASYKGSGAITADAVCLGQNQNITVKVAGDFEMVSAENATLSYEVKIGDNTTAITSGATVATFGTSTSQQSVTLNYSAANPTYAGNYTDTLTFTISAPAN